MRELMVFAALLGFLGCGRAGSNPDEWTDGYPPGYGSGGGGGGGASVDTNYRALLNWGAATGSPDAYVVLQSQNGTNWTATETTTSTTAYVDGLTQGSTYYFRVAAYNSTGTSTSTSTVTLTL